jgi:hypothetical protein
LQFRSILRGESNGKLGRVVRVARRRSVATRREAPEPAYGIASIYSSKRTSYRRDDPIYAPYAQASTLEPVSLCAVGLWFSAQLLDHDGSDGGVRPCPSGVIVRAGVFPAGLRSSSAEFTALVVTRA